MKVSPRIIKPEDSEIIKARDLYYSAFPEPERVDDDHMLALLKNGRAILLAIDAADADRFYHLSLLKKGADVRFAIDGLDILHYHDDGTAFGPRLGGGCIGLRQLAPMIGEYANLRVTRPD